ncbi:MAG: His/Gly/Thr/Pro-type tRNA ligase C-terminal domain-containing protein, partial [Nitrososphaera sp.]|nr:His/Gly/Thr/Pro-type tRNA ligase C-terminal domain-containing protein [Nitrososphaera sp.]
VLDAAEVPHYSKGNIDMEIETSFGTIEMTGNAYRTDFDLSQHAKQSGSDLSVFVDSEKKKVVPHVFELSMGVDRTFYAILEHCYRPKDTDTTEKEGEASEGGRAKKEWEWFDFPAVIAPYHVAVFPLMTKDGLEEKAVETASMLREKGLDVLYSYSGSIGRRYARADEIGIPYALTIDYDTLKDGTVTIRYRNDGKQERIKVSGAESFIRQKMNEGKVTL